MEQRPLLPAIEHDVSHVQLEAFWPTVITGPVGLGGIAARLSLLGLAARRQSANLVTSIEANRDAARTAERRRVYAAFLAAVDTTYETLTYGLEDLDKAAGESLETGKPFSASDFFPVRISSTLGRALNEVILVGSRNVVDATRPFVAIFSTFFTERGSPRIEAPRPEWAKRYREQRAAVTRAMREDLGEAPYEVYRRNQMTKNTRLSRAVPEEHDDSQLF